MNNLSRYYRLLLEVKWTFLGGLLCGMVYSLTSGAGLPAMAKTVFPILFRDERQMAEVPRWMLAATERLAWSQDALLLATCVALPLVFLVRGVAGFLNTYLVNKAGLEVLERIRVMSFAKLQRLPWAFFQDQGSGDLVSRLTNDSQLLRMAITQSSNDLIKQPLTLLAALGYLVFHAFSKDSVFFALIGMCAVPVCVLPIMRVRRQIGARSRALQAQTGSLNTMLVEDLQSPLEIRVYQLERPRIARFAAAIRRQLRLQLKIAKYRALISPAIELVASVGFAWSLYMGVRRGLGLGDFMALGMALYMAFEPVKKLGTVSSVLAQGGAAAARIEMILSAEETVTSPAVPKATGVIEGRIEFRDVEFAYGRAPVLHGVNLVLRPGQMVALVGPSGSGKSTMAGLIPRLFDVTGGSVRVDGTDVREWDLEALRRQIAVVPQSPMLFQMSILENIRASKEGAGAEQIERAIRQAHATEFVAELPQGVETVVGERGSTLSGGQRQRIAVARAFLKDAPILILDEATSSLDVESEAAVAESLRELAQGRTTVVIAHRVSTIRIAERVVLLQDGRIVGDGTLPELGEDHPLIRMLES